MSALLVLIALSATPLETAQRHLKAGKLDDVLFALDGQAFTGDDKPKAAERYCDTWIEVDGANAQARLLRAQLAVENADWQVALDQLAAAKFSGADAKKAQLIKTKATKELSDKKSSQSAIAALEKQIADASKARDKEPATVTPVDEANTNDVILSMTSWCGYCRKARAFLNARKVFFTEKDIERDPEASKELAQKAARAGVKPQGVPVIDVRGKLVLGFDQNALDGALQ